MSCESLSTPRRLLLLGTIVSAYRRWRWARARTICERCVVCGHDLENDANRLLREGYLRAAVFSSRLQLELTLMAICDDIGDVEGHKRRFERVTAAGFVCYMRSCRWIDRSTGNRIKATYGRASKIVHGAAVTHYRARHIINEIREVIELMDGAKVSVVNRTPKVITGFQRPEVAVECGELDGFQLLNTVEPIAAGGAA